MADKLKTVALIILCLSLVAGCAADTSGNYEVLDQLPVSSDASEDEFDFSSTLRLLYPKSETVVIAQLKSVGLYVSTAVSVHVLEGEILVEDIEFTVSLPSGSNPEEGGMYFLFLTDDGESYASLSDDNGLIKLEDDILTTDAGAKVSLAQAMSELDKMQSYIYIPSYFYYQKELESLVVNSSVICIGTVASTEILPDAKFYVREPGLEEITSVEAITFSIEVEDFLKGEALNSVQVILTDSMYHNTIIESTFDQPNYSKESLPELSNGGRYLFFLMNSPAGKHGDYMLFVNPYQGYVPLYEDDTLIAIPINAPFSYIQNLEDVRLDIEDIVNGFAYSNYAHSDQESEVEFESPPPDDDVELP